MVHQNETSVFGQRFLLYFFPFQLSGYIPSLRSILSSEVNVMSPKELLYIDDALGHEKFLINQCQQAANALTDPQLRSFTQQLAQHHQQLFNKLYQLI